MKRLINSVFGAFGYHVRRGPSAEPALREFTIGAMRFVADPCSVGQTPQGELTALGAIRMIRERQLTGLKVLDICCGVGIIGLTLWSQLNESCVAEVAFADINIFNLNSVRRTLAANDLARLLGTRMRCWLSDGLGHIPSAEKFDLIVSNPPHFFSSDSISTPPVPDGLGTYDEQWAFHASFYRQCHEHLTDRGEVWFLENSAGAKESDLLPFVHANPSLQYIGRQPEPSLPGFFWMFTTTKERNG